MAQNRVLVRFRSRVELYANASDKPRISASCNIMFRNYTQIMSRPTPLDE